MLFRVIIFSFFTLSTLGCTYSPHSQNLINLIKDDNLSDEQKIDVIESNNEKQSAATLFAIARLYENQKDWPKALDAIQRAIQADPMNSSFHSKKAAYEYELGHKSIAYREALTAYQLGSKSLQQSLDLARMGVALSEYSIVNNIIDSLLIAYPENEDVLYMTARKYHHNKELAKASYYYNKVNLVNPENQLNNFYFAQLLILQNKIIEADSILGNVDLKLNEAIQINELLASTYFKMEAYDNAALYYRELSNQRADSTVYNRLIDCYYQLKYDDSVIATAKSALLRYPENKHYHLLAARSYNKRYRYPEAMEYYQKAYELDTLDTLLKEEISILQRKIAYLQRIKEEQRKLADSLQIVDSARLNN